MWLWMPADLPPRCGRMWELIKHKGNKNSQVILGLPLQMEGCPSGIQSQNCLCDPMVSQLPTRVKDALRPYPSIPNLQLRNRMTEGRPQGQPGPRLHLQLQDHSPRDEKPGCFGRMQQDGLVATATGGS